MEAMGLLDNDLEFSIVSGQNEEMLFGCLESLTKTMTRSQYSWSVTVTCDIPGSGLPGRLRVRYPAVAVFDSPKSRGLAAGHNRVLRVSRARYVWLLTDDVLLLPDAVRMVTEFMDRPGNSRVGLAGPQLLNPDGSLQPSTYRFPSMSQILLAHSGLHELPFTQSLPGRLSRIPGLGDASSRDQPHDRTVEVDTLRGACVAVRMKAARQVGPIDEIALLGCQETEWHRRFHEQGWTVIYLTEASVIHYGSQTAREGSRNVHPQYLEEALYFFRMGRGPTAYSTFCATMMAIFGLRATIASLMRDRSGASAARRNARVTWDALKRM